MSNRKSQPCNTMSKRALLDKELNKCMQEMRALQAGVVNVLITPMTPTTTVLELASSFFTTRFETTKFATNEDLRRYVLNLFMGNWSAVKDQLCILFNGFADEVLDKCNGIICDINSYNSTLLSAPQTLKRSDVALNSLNHQILRRSVHIISLKSKIASQVATILKLHSEATGVTFDGADLNNFLDMYSVISAEANAANADDSLLGSVAVDEDGISSDSDGSTDDDASSEESDKDEDDIGDANAPADGSGDDSVDADAPADVGSGSGTAAISLNQPASTGDELAATSLNQPTASLLLELSSHVLHEIQMMGVQLVEVVEYLDRLPAVSVPH